MLFLLGVLFLKKGVDTLVKAFGIVGVESIPNAQAYSLLETDLTDQILKD